MGLFGNVKIAEWSGNMANRVTNDDILKINKIYAEVGTYAETARRTGFSPSTVKKYVNPNFSAAQAATKTVEISISNNFLPYPTDGFAWREMILLSKEEIDEIAELRKEVLI